MFPNENQVVLKNLAVLMYRFNRESQRWFYWLVPGFSSQLSHIWKQPHSIMQCLSYSVLASSVLCGYFRVTEEGPRSQTQELYHYCSFFLTLCAELFLMMTLEKLLVFWRKPPVYREGKEPWSQRVVVHIASVSLTAYVSSQPLVFFLNVGSFHYILILLTWTTVKY